MTRVRVVTRPIERWPGRLLNDRERKTSPFTATFPATLDLLLDEAAHLGASEIVLQLALDESDIRLDGWPYAQARTRHPGVIVSVEAKGLGPLSFPCDRFGDGIGHGRHQLRGWKANLRAVALAMEALRKVDRYGVVREHEQYVGWRALGAGDPIPAGPAQQMTADEALEVLRTGAGWDCGPDHDDPDGQHRAYRAAAKRLHPDTDGGSVEAFQRLREAMHVLGLSS